MGVVSCPFAEVILCGDWPSWDVKFVHCQEVKCCSEVKNVLSPYNWLGVGSLSVSWRVRYGRFYCTHIHVLLQCLQLPEEEVFNTGSVMKQLYK